MRNVLIPTDFTEASLSPAWKAVQLLEGQSLNLMLFHAFRVPFFAADIIGNRGKPPYSHLVTEEFRLACKRLKLQHTKTIRSICIRHMYGDTAAVFRNFADAQEVDLLVLPDDYRFVPVHRESVDPAPLFKKSGLPFLKDFGAQKMLIDIRPGLFSELSAVLRQEYMQSEVDQPPVKKEDYAAER